MKFSSADFYRLRWSLAAITLSILLSIIILYSSSKYADATQKDQHTAAAQMNEARNRLDMANQDQENLAVFSREYDLLDKNKIIGDEQRLDWVEGLEKLRGQNLVVDFRYNVAPQRIYVPQPAIDSGNFDIHYSEMKLQFELLHEGQLLNFFDALRKQVEGHYQLEGCTMLHSDIEEHDATPEMTHLKAECSGGWITLKNRNVQP